MVIGRSFDCDVQLADATVSRVHARLHFVDGRFHLENCSSSGATIVGGRRLAPDERVDLDTAAPSFQIGRVLLGLEMSEDATANYSEVLDERTVQSAKSETTPFLSLRWESGAVHIRCKGQFMNLYPTSAKLLAALCSACPNPVPSFELQDAIGETASIEQQVSYIRKAFERLLESGTLSTRELCQHIARHNANLNRDELSTESVRQLLRRFIAARRGFGYMLLLSGDEVAFDGVE